MGLKVAPCPTRPTSTELPKQLSHENDLLVPFLNVAVPEIGVPTSTFVVSSLICSVKRPTDECELIAADVHPAKPPLDTKSTANIAITRLMMSGHLHRKNTPQTEHGLPNVKVSRVSPISHS